MLHFPSHPSPLLPHYSLLTLLPVQPPEIYSLILPFCHDNGQPVIDILQAGKGAGLRQVLLPWKPRTNLWVTGHKGDVFLSLEGERERREGERERGGRERERERREGEREEGREGNEGRKESETAHRTRGGGAHFGINAHGSGHLGILLLPRLNARSRVNVESVLQTFECTPVSEIREEEEESVCVWGG